MFIGKTHTQIVSINSSLEDNLKMNFLDIIFILSL